MDKQPCQDIHTLHAELIHPARDIRFQIAYKNGIDDAVIIGIDRKNVQSALESYFAQVGIPIRHALPIGPKNGVNIDYATPDEYIGGTLEVFLGGDRLDAGVDYTESLDRKGFRIVVDPNHPVRLNRPPLQLESLTCAYSKRITFKTKGGT